MGGEENGRELVETRNAKRGKTAFGIKRRRQKRKIAKRVSREKKIERIESKNRKGI